MTQYTKEQVELMLSPLPRNIAFTIAEGERIRLGVELLRLHFQPRSKSICVFAARRTQAQDFARKVQKHLIFVDCADHLRGRDELTDLVWLATTFPEDRRQAIKDEISAYIGGRKTMVWTVGEF